MARKSGNGQGITNGFSIQFDLSDEAQREAYEVAMKYARPHGRRKHLIVTFLLAIKDYEDSTGRDFRPEQIAAMLMASAHRPATQHIASPEMPHVEALDIGLIQSTQIIDPEKIGAALVGGSDWE